MIYNYIVSVTSGRFQLTVYSWRFTRTWVDNDTDQSGPPWKVVPWPVVGRHRPAWRKSAADLAGRTQCFRAQSTVHSAKSSQLGPSSPRLFYHVKQVGWVQQCQTYSSKSSSRRGSAAEKGPKKFFCSGVRTVLRAKPIPTPTLSKDLQLWTKQLLGSTKAQHLHYFTVEEILVIKFFIVPMNE